VPNRPNDLKLREDPRPDRCKTEDATFQVPTRLDPKSESELADRVNQRSDTADPRQIADVTEAKDESLANDRIDMDEPSVILLTIEISSIP
jgi:hypothetical protein